MVSNPIKMDDLGGFPLFLETPIYRTPKKLTPNSPPTQIARKLQVLDPRPAPNRDIDSMTRNLQRILGDGNSLKNIKMYFEPQNGGGWKRYIFFFNLVCVCVCYVLIIFFGLKPTKTPDV